MTEDLEPLLKNLHLTRILEIYDEQLRTAGKEELAYSEFVARLLRAQWHARQEGTLQWRIRHANLPERWPLETFPFARPPGVQRKQIRGFAELEFIAKASSSGPRICSMRCMRPWPTAPRANCSNASPGWTSC
jgi:hypothetical protein